MPDKQVKIPGPDHPITIAPNPARVRIVRDGRVLADTRRALTLREAKHSPVHYIPRADADMAALSRTEHSTYCPFKGDAAYYSLPGGDAGGVNAVWTYESPFPAVAAIRDHLAFYPDRVEISETA